MHPHLKFAGLFSGLLHGVLLTWSAGKLGDAAPPRAPGIQITTPVLSSQAAPELDGQTPEIETHVLVLPESAQVGQRQFRFELPARKMEPMEVARLNGELPPPQLQRAETDASPEADATARSQTMPIPRRLPPPASVPHLASRAMEQTVGTRDEQLPRPLANPAPIYPLQARVNRWQGTVLVELFITTQGEVGSVQLVRSSGYAILDAEAQRTLRRWRFEPARRDGESVAMSVRLPIHFRLE